MALMWTPPTFQSGVRKQVFNFFPLKTSWKTKRLLLVLCICCLLVSTVFHVVQTVSWLVRWSRGSRVVILSPYNVGGGVKGWKDPKDQTIEKISIMNKKAYAKFHGYSIEFVDMHDQRRYMHEYRNSWAMIDAIRMAMDKYKNAEWFWWLDRTTCIIEKEISLEDQVFSLLPKGLVRDLKRSNMQNPLKFDDIEGVDYLQDINMILTQDCQGFNMGSWLIRRSNWADMVLDVIWDPVFYNLKHSDWMHNEQDAFQTLYLHQCWVRSGTAFISQRKINAYSPEACSGFENDASFFYLEKDRDFVVNMAGCSWGRDCLSEMATYWKLSKSKEKKWI